MTLLLPITEYGSALVYLQQVVTFHFFLLQAKILPRPKVQRHSPYSCRRNVVKFIDQAEFSGKESSMFTDVRILNLGRDTVYSVWFAQSFQKYVG
jgi:hypothetical protein